MINARGQSMVEIVIALFIISALIASFGGLALGGNMMQSRSGQILEARALSSEGLEAVRAIRHRNWEELTFNRSALTIEGGEWRLAGEGTVERIGRFTRSIDFSPVYRNGSFEIVESTSPEAVPDENSREISVSITWESRPGAESTISDRTYLTNYNE